MEVFYFIWFGIVPPDSCSYNFLSCSAQRVSQTGSGKNNYIRIVFIFFLVYWSCLQRSRGLGAKLRLRYIWLGAQAYIFPWCLPQIFCLECLVLSGVVGSWFLILKKCPILAVTLIGWCQDMQELYIYLGACLHLKCICFVYSQLFFRTFFAYLLLHHPPPLFSMIIILQGRDLPQKILGWKKRY